MCVCVRALQVAKHVLEFLDDRPLSPSPTPETLPWRRVAVTLGSEGRAVEWLARSPTVRERSASVQVQKPRLWRHMSVLIAILGVLWAWTANGESPSCFESPQRSRAVDQLDTARMLDWSGRAVAAERQLRSLG